MLKFLIEKVYRPEIKTNTRDYKINNVVTGQRWITSTESNSPKKAFLTETCSVIQKHTDVNEFIINV